MTKQERRKSGHGMACMLRKTEAEDADGSGRLHGVVNVVLEDAWKQTEPAMKGFRNDVDPEGPNHGGTRT